MSTYKPLITTNGQVYQLDDPDGLTVAYATNVDYIQFDTAYADGIAEGRLQWNSADGTLEVGMPGGNVNLQIGQETLVRVRNVTGNTINNGTLVTFNGSQANRPKIEVFDDTKHDLVCAYATETINHNSYGYVTLQGLVRNVDTSTYNEGDHLWADVNNPGMFTATVPVPPQHRWCVGIVLVADENNGVIYADFHAWHHLEELSDVSLNSANLIGGETIIWDVDGEYWKATGSPDTFPQYSHLKTGWEEGALSRGQVNLTVNAANRTLTLTPTGNAITYWIKGVPYTVNTTQNITWNDAEGMWYLKMTANGPSSTQVHWEFDDTAAFVASLYWDATNKAVILWAPEFHSWDISQPLQEYIHETFGVRWASGLGCAINTGNATINTANGVLWDQTTKFTITDDAGSGYHDQTLTPLTSPVIYRTGASGAWRKLAASSNLCYISSNVPQINTFNGSEWIWQAVGVNQYFAYWVVASTAVDEPIYLIPGQEESSSLSNATANNVWSDLSWGALPTQEHKVIARLILQRQGVSPYYTIAQLDDYRNTADEPSSAGGSGSGTSDHGSLTGLGDDDHTQYVLADGSRAFTGNVTVNASLGMTGNITAYGGSTPSNNNVLAWTTANSRFEAKEIALTDLANVTTGTPNTGDVLTYNSGNSVWYAAAEPTHTLNDLSDVVTTNAATGCTLTYNSGNSTWYPAAEPTHTLNDLSDVTTANAATGDALTYNSGNSTWYPAASAASSSISSNTTYYVATTGNDTTGNGTANSPWATIGKVYDYLADKRIEADAYVTVQLADGTYAFTSTVNVNHPDSNKITVTGNLVNSITSSNIVSISGTQPNRTMVLTVSDTTKCAAGDVIKISGVAGGTKPGLILGAARVESVNSGNNTITANFYQRTTRYAPSGAVTSNIDVFKTNVTFNACDGFTVSDGNFLKLDKVGIDGLSLTNTFNAVTANTGGIVVCSEDVAIIRFNYGFYATAGGLLKANYAACGGSAVAFFAEAGSEIYADYAMSNGCSSYGLQLTHGSYANAYGFVSVGHGNVGIVLTNAMAKADYAYVVGNGGAGAIVQQGSSLYATYITLAWCESRGILVQFNSYADIYAANITTNQDTGAYCYANSTARADASSVTSNANGGVYVAMNSTCSIAGAGISGNTGFQTSPATLYTVGNYESFVF